jgi:hypothetical protein
MNNLEKWTDFMARLLSASKSIDKEIWAKSGVGAKICRALLKKGTDTLRAIQLLYKETLPLQGQILVRVIVEVRIDLEIILQLRSSIGEVATVTRIKDAMMLAKHKQQKASNFHGVDMVDGAVGPEQFREIENTIVERIGKEAAECLRSKGFSGLNIEQRAKKVGLNDLYQVVYRNFSRNVHNTDYAELLSAGGLYSIDGAAEFEELRNRVALSTAITCAWHMESLLNEQFQCGFRADLEEMWKIFTTFEGWINQPMAE